ncbi:MAG: DUF255 domain-containing protein, partial [Hydrogenophaga sp.]|uniref:thioredoxin domain-containing protein n=1 Tax=Hydrogenophaga sp. TaxID=1904254 RepID=UPI00169289AA
PPAPSAESAAAGETPVKAPYPPALQTQLRAALAARGADYRPRTEHLLANGAPEFTNRLILQDSPYLLQHAHNPVDWYPWGEEAFARARRENKPVFLSIGYSTCHWCHVMERESFDSKAIARILNADFIAIKVDRERRPDVDASYMTAVTLLTGRGGWPLSAFLTPDGNLFFGGTYFPPDAFAEILSRVLELWQKNPALLFSESAKVAEAVASTMANRGTVKEVGASAIVAAVNATLERHDSLEGGFSEAPKFPSEPLLFLLLEHALRTGDEQALEAAETTLQAMARGGIYDQVGGGFHRYSIDPQWLVPHFEKMLYNQANLARLYTEAYRLTGHAGYQRIARQTLDYVLRDMTSPEGAFYSATDADSEGEEGAFFLWTPAQLRAVLGEQDAALAMALYGVSENGNFEGRSILHLPM